MTNIQIKSVADYDENTVKVIVTADDFGPCTFIFSDRFITCFGDIESFTWDCTWKTAERIRQGYCAAENFQYLLSKLDHKERLMEFDQSLMEAKLEDIKKQVLEDMDEDEREEFIEKWDGNEYLLSDVEEHRLGNLDDFFSELGIDDPYEYYEDFYKVPAHYRCAVGFLKAIENHFKEKAK